MTNNDLQNITLKTKDRITRTPLKIGVNLAASEGYVISIKPVSPSIKSTETVGKGKLLTAWLQLKVYLKDKRETTGYEN